MQKAVLIIWALLSNLNNVIAQSYTISGYVTDENKKPIVSAVVLLSKKTDSAWSHSALTDTAGYYKIEQVNPETYIAKTIAQGYSDEKQTVNITDHTTLNLSVKTTSNALKEVVVTDQQPTIETSFGKIIVNLNTTRTAAGNSALDILRKAPGVRIDAGGNVLLNGTNVLILIDEKPTYLAGKDLEEYLKSLSAEQLTQIELMTRPSAKYDKEGSGGIINLKTKTIKNKGLHGISTTSVSLAQLVHPAVRSNLNLNYNNGKLNLFTHAGYIHVQGFLDEKLQRTITDPKTGQTSQMQQNAFYKETWEDYNLQAGLDYKYSPKTKTGFSVKGIYHPNKEKDQIHTTLENNNLTHNQAQRNHELYKNSVMANAYWKHNPDNKSNIAVNTDYIHRHHNLRLLFDSKGYDHQKQPNGQNLKLHSDAPFITDIYSLKADYEKQIPKDIKIETGIKSSLVTIDNASYFQTHNGKEWQHDSTRSNQFIYHENINAIYTNLSQKISDKWNAQIGLRAENTNIKGTQFIGNKTISRTFISLFPVAYLGYKPNESHNLEINYGRRTTRPNYAQLNPFITYTSQYQYETGNAELLPAFDHTLEIRHNYKNQLFSSLELRRRNNIINPVIYQDTATNSIIITSANNANKNALHASTHLMKELFKWWNFAASADMYYQAYKLKTENKIFSKSIGYSFSLQNNFNLGHSWTIDSSYYWGSGDLQNMIERNRTNQWLSLSVSKKLFKDTTTIKLSFEDPFNAYQQTMVSNWNGVETTSENKYLSQQISFGLTYNFGKQKENTERNNSNIEETKRM